MVNLKHITIAMLLSAASAGIAPAQAQDLVLFEKTFFSWGSCDPSRDALPIFGNNWENQTISIKEASVHVLFSGQNTIAGYLYAGDNTPGSDIMPYQLLPPGVVVFDIKETMPAGTAMPLALGAHVDTHISCGPLGLGFQVYLIVKYTKAGVFVN